ncbi:GNAT family N-acetyltransferase [Leucobacter japonicus]|uniref:GNAT family N-acetyltransferase n=1 Tax=Leucobacter japonicus TaxID=1461259 RepID=UPI0006A7CF85|nr:GNAT family N-acetyltransferase [Leucobacter japonicus]
MAADIIVFTWTPGSDDADRALRALLADYHLETEREKGMPVADVDALPDRYRREVHDPARAFADDRVLVAIDGGAAVGCVVLRAPRSGISELTRLWADPAARGRGVASALVDTAATHARSIGTLALRLSVWEWRSPAIALYERRGFTRVDSWDERPQLVCMEHRLAPLGD